MNWYRWDFAQVGRLAGAVIITGGIALAAWAATDLPRGFPSDAAARYFLGAVLTYAFWGFTVMLVAELTLQMGWTGRQAIDEVQVRESDASEHVGAPPLVRVETVWASWNNVNLIQVGRAAGVLIVIGGVILAGWDALAARQVVFYNPVTPVALTTRDAAKLFLANVLQYTFYGFVVILLAELADRVGQRTEEETRETDEAPEAGSQTA